MRCRLKGRADSGLSFFRSCASNGLAGEGGEKRNATVEGKVNGMKAAILHTTALTVAPLQALAKQIMPEVEILHIAEDAMIADVIKHDGPTPAINARIASYIMCAEKAGCRIFMTACSSIAEIVENCQMLTTMRLARIDMPMAQAAVEKGGSIAVLATVETTMKPTVNLIVRKAAERDAKIQVKKYLMPGAYRALLGGDPATHDAMVKDALQEAAKNCDVIVLAQASMARVLSGLDTPITVPVLTSPELGIRYLKVLAEEIQQ